MPGLWWRDTGHKARARAAAGLTNSSARGAARGAGADDAHANRARATTDHADALARLKPPTHAACSSMNAAALLLLATNAIKAVPQAAVEIKHVTQVGFLADGTKGKFKILELGEVSESSAAPSSAPAPSVGSLSLFEFSKSSKPWRVTDDPVMGGVSHSAFKVIDGVGVWVGEVKTVPKLQAPGTCQANSATFASVDASSYDAIEIKLISKAELKQFQSVS